MTKKKTDTSKRKSAPNASGKAPKPVNKKQKIDALQKLSEISEGKVVTIPLDAIVNVPISGSFKKAIEETLHYVMHDMDVQEIIIAMRKIRTGFKDVKPEEVTHKEKSCWVLMSIISEMNFQAAEQKLTVITDDKIDERMSDAISGLDTDPAIADLIAMNEEYKDFLKDKGYTREQDNTDEND
tara:strand:- start:660 stop:1208 length:549 start_codon:yes stop_codon:yes gene_type:complete